MSLVCFVIKLMNFLLHRAIKDVNLAQYHCVFLNDKGKKSQIPAEALKMSSMFLKTVF